MRWFQGGARCLTMDYGGSIGQYCLIYIPNCNDVITQSGGCVDIVTQQVGLGAFFPSFRIPSFTPSLFDARVCPLQGGDKKNRAEGHFLLIISSDLHGLVDFDRALL